MLVAHWGCYVLVARQKGGKERWAWAVNLHVVCHLRGSPLGARVTSCNLCLWFGGWVSFKARGDLQQWKVLSQVVEVARSSTWAELLCFMDPHDSKSWERQSTLGKHPVVGTGENGEEQWRGTPILVAAPELAPAVLDQTYDSGESQLELGYLLEASDDELGLPPTISPEEETKIEAVDFDTSSLGAAGLTGFLGFENEIPNYDSFEFGVGFDPYSNTDDTSGELVALGGLFDYSDRSFEPAENSEFLYLPE
ncbi:hypothetical protein F2P56_013141 [Juglans regia]|uniref:Uncharacterized protein n=1 Tax=Juglans regia TaxID=51240 RepID=A0A834CXX0_JUGRE|nr:hypothetical protein F2P56_013141 [Juglans regia]